MMGGVRNLWQSQEVWLSFFASIGQSQEVWLSLIAEEINEGEVFGLFKKAIRPFEGEN
jgi:hypothetical protein